MRVISVLGSTGSIGTQSLEVIQKLGYSVAALTANTNVALIEKQIRQFKPKLAVMYDPELAKDLAKRVSDIPVTVMAGMEGLVAASEISDADTVITAVSGMIGLIPTMAAINKGKRIALANKETLVCAGELVMAATQKCGAEIIPVDSEHSAIFQCLSGREVDNQVKRLILTASGGPFRGYSAEMLKNVTLNDALKHPNWKMGHKITIDSATLMNKGLEFIEAMHLFNAKPEKIGILVHPQSIIHSMVEFTDNSILAQLGTPNMKLPIRYALTYPDRAENQEDSTLNLCDVAALTFEQPDMEVFRCLKLAIEAAKRGGNACALLNAANEIAVHMFLEGRIHFCDIYSKVAYVMDKANICALNTIDDVFEAQNQTCNLLGV